MTTYIRTKVGGDSVIEVNGVEAVVIGSGGITSGIGKNKLINGNFGINQRVVTGTVVLAAGIYGHDRFKAGASGCTYTFATVNNVTTITISAGSLQQVVEGLNLFSGDVVLSWAGTAQGKIGTGAYGPSGVTGTAVGGTNLTVEFSTGTVSLVQLETGTIKSAFEQRSVGHELALCQRYYERASTACAPIYSGSVTSGGVYYHSQRYQVEKMAVPTVILTEVASNSFAASAPALANNGSDGFNVSKTASATGASGYFQYRWTASAEL